MSSDPIAAKGGTTMRCPTLSELPFSPAGKTGWPWTQESPRLPDVMCNGHPWPKISIATPNYNYGQFIEETIRSVLLQGYPNLEYIIIDDGSTDNSIEIIKKYEKWITCWETRPKRSQAHAINTGFLKATGDIFAWLNSDDLYLPEALSCITSSLDIKEAELIFGSYSHYSESTSKIAGSDVRTAHKRCNLLLVDYIIQPSSFWTKKVWVNTGLLDKNLDCVFDWDWFIRAQKASTVFKPADNYLSIYRMHKSNKTGTGGIKRLNELRLIYRRYMGAKYEKVFLECCDNRGRINFVKKWLRRTGLSYFEMPLLKFIFKDLFFDLIDAEIKDIVSMG